MNFIKPLLTASFFVAGVLRIFVTVLTSGIVGSVRLPAWLSGENGIAFETVLSLILGALLAALLASKHGRKAERKPTR